MMHLVVLCSFAVYFFVSHSEFASGNSVALVLSWECSRLFLSAGREGCLCFLGEWVASALNPQCPLHGNHVAF